MNEKHKEIYDFPLHKIENDWPFDPKLALDLFYANSFNSYESLYDYISGFELIDSNDGETSYNNFFIRNDKCYYYGIDYNVSTLEGRFELKLYTLEKIPYSLVVCSAIKYILTKCSEESSENSSDILVFGGKTIMEYLMFTTIPVKKIIEENTVLKRNKKKFLYEVYMGFLYLQTYYQTKINSFFF